MPTGERASIHRETLRTRRAIRASCFRASSSPHNGRSSRKATPPASSGLVWVLEPQRSSIRPMLTSVRCIRCAARSLRVSVSSSGPAGHPVVLSLADRINPQHRRRRQALRMQEDLQCTDMGPAFLTACPFARRWRDHQRHFLRLVPVPSMRLMTLDRDATSANASRKPGFGAVVPAP